MTVSIALMQVTFLYSYVGHTQPARDVPGTSPEGLNVWNLQGTLRGPTKN